MSERSIRLAEDTISREEVERLAAWLVTGAQLTKGPLTVEFERRLAAWVGSRHAVMVNSGSSANLLMAFALLEAGYLRNRRVVIPAVSWITTLSPFLQLGFDVSLCDSDPADLGVDLGHLERLLRERSPALLVVVHVLGHPCRMDEIRALCERHGCLVVEDACEALGTGYRGRRAGHLSLAGSFSFYYGHQMSTVEGGAVVTDDDRLFAAMLSIRSHGWSRDVPPAEREAWRARHDVDEFRELYTFYFPGFNLRSSDINAFLGIHQLEKMDRVVGTRGRNFARYAAGLGDFWVQRSEADPLSSFAYGTFVENRLEVFRHLRDRGVESRPLVCGSMGRQPFWVDRFGATRLPIADRVHDSGIYLPNHASLTEAQVDRVVRTFREVARPLPLDPPPAW